MCALSNTLREKPMWWVKAKNSDITTKWRAEVLEQQEGLSEERQLTEEMVRTPKPRFGTFGSSLNNTGGLRAWRVGRVRVAKGRIYGDRGA